MAPAAGAGTGRPTHCQSTLGAVTLEDFRQPEAQSGADGSDAAGAGLLAAVPGTGLFWSVAGGGDHHPARSGDAFDSVGAEAHRPALADVSPVRGGQQQPSALPDPAHAGLPPL